MGVHAGFIDEPALLTDLYLPLSQLFGTPLVLSPLTIVPTKLSERNEVPTVIGMEYALGVKASESFQLELKLLHPPHQRVEVSEASAECLLDERLTTIELLNAA